MQKPYIVDRNLYERENVSFTDVRICRISISEINLQDQTASELSSPARMRAFPKFNDFRNADFHETQFGKIFSLSVFIRENLR